MGLYLGNVGQIVLTRKSIEGSKESLVNPSDVNANANRFSFDFDEGLLITGDLVEFTTTDGTNLDFVDASGWSSGQVQSSGNWYVFVDLIGGVKLYSSFAGSLDGGTDDLIPLTSIARDIPISIKVRDRDKRILASVTEYELNTNREVVDVTALSDQHRQQYSSLISGSGSLTAHWDYANNNGEETVHYLMQLILRTEIGALFHGQFYIKAENTVAQTASFDAAQTNDALWWDFDAIVTNSAVSFSSPELITGRIEFITTGPIRLRAEVEPGVSLLQQSGGAILVNQPGGGALQP